MSRIQTIATLGSLAASASAHGIVQGIVAGGKWYSGYNPSFQFADPPPTVIGWSVPDDLSLGFVSPDNYSNPDIICHIGATPAGASAKVAAGSVVELQWTIWPSSHHGPVLDYLAKCSGSCTDVDKTTLEFFKIDEGGLINDATPPGTWADDQLIANNNSWVVTIPKSIAPGNYVLRHEIIALHSAGELDGAQNYPQCVNLEITGSGSDSPTGELGTALYKANEPGILIDIYTSLSTYKIPGPTLISGAVSMKQTTIPFSGDGMPVTGPAASATPAAASSSGAAASTSSAAASSSVTAAPSSSAVSVVSASSTVVSFSSFVNSSSADSYSAPLSSSSAAGNTSISLSASISAPASTSDCTITVTAKSSSSAVATVSSSSAVAPAASSVASSSVASSSVVSSTMASSSAATSSVVASSSAAPTLSSHASSAAPTPTRKSHRPYPAEKPIPKGFTFGDLLEWLKYTVSHVFNNGKKHHARDFTVK